MASYSVGHGATEFASYTYTYDVMGRITGDGTYTYVYDDLGQLTTVKQGNTVVESYTYDGAGNILSANKNGTSHTYTYGNTNWRDQLTAYDGTAITYDEIGNPLSYRGWAFTWQNGRQLATASKSGTSISYAYDVNGLRYSKTVGGVTHNYIYSGSTLLQEKYGTTVLNFLYDADGTPYAVQYSTNSGSTFTTYYYITNLQGDVIGLMNNSGTLVVSYTYDAWGVLLTTTGSLASTLGATNPLRYRGYYYDTETSLYYLQSRYYDPQVVRFVNVDAFASTGQGIVGFNMYAYCLNCPVMFYDSYGRMAFPVDGGYYDEPSCGFISPSTTVSSGTGAVVSIAASVKIGQQIRSLISTGYQYLKRILSIEETEEEVQEPESSPKTPEVSYPGDDPTVAPEGYEWRGPDEQGGKRGGYANPNGKDSWHPDLDHPNGVDPHWDYNDGFGNKWRVFPDGTIELAK